MKTWEVIKNLSQNNDKIFKNEMYPNENITLSYEKSKLILKRNVEKINLELISLWDEWEEVKQPVSWQEAIKHYMNNNSDSIFSFSIEFEGETFKQRTIYRLGVLHIGDGKKYGFEKSMFTEGKWYIED